MHIASNDQQVWFAMRATYRREMTVKQYLDVKSIESFIPMRYEWQLRNGRRQKVLKPAVSNLLFVHSSKNTLNELKPQLPYLHFLTCPCDGRKVPIVVPDDEMRRFIAIAGTNDDQLIYLQPQDINLAKGTRVRLHGGMFDGQEGIFMKVKGARNKRLVVAIQGVIAVATVVVHPELVEVLP